MAAGGRHHYRTFQTVGIVWLLAIILSPQAGLADHDNSPTMLSVFPDQVQITGRDEVQLVVCEWTTGGLTVERTGDARFRSLNGNVIDVSSTGQITPVGNGQGTVEVSLQSYFARVTVDVIDVGESPTPDFETDIQPILATRGCSTGACHGKQGGQNGFQLSLLGFDSDFDHAAITKEARGRRVFAAAPENSLLLKKATAEVPHGGGSRFRRGAAHYEALLNWIQSGSPRQGDRPVKLEQITVNPSELIMAPDSKHRLVVTATFSDGSRRDVTSLTALSSNESAIAAVGEQASIAAGPIAGEAAIMARFMDQIATCRVLLPRREAIDQRVYEQLPRENFVDDLAWRRLARLKILPSEQAPDATYLRRVYVDIIGRQPTPDVVRQFLADEAPDKRRRLVDQLLEHPGYADHWANKWVDLLRPNPYRVGIKAVMSFDNWIRQAFRDNRPYDQFARAADGTREHLAQRREHALSRPSVTRRADHDCQPAVSRCAFGVCQMPPPPLRSLGTRRLLRIRGLIRPRRPQRHWAVATHLWRRGNRLHGRQRQRHAPAHGRNHVAAHPRRSIAGVTRGR